MLTILPILGAAMVVAARQGAGEGSLLGLSPIQRIGDWSYSIYLWHWPIWVFALSWLAVRGYERRQRAKDVDGAGSRWRSARFPTAMSNNPSEFAGISGRRAGCWRLPPPRSPLFAGFVSLAFLNHGFPGRLPEYLLPAELARRTNTPRDECFRNANSTKKTTETYCSFGSAQAVGRVSAILWGDSFANQYLEPISSAALGNGSTD